MISHRQAAGIYRREPENMHVGTSNYRFWIAYAQDIQEWSTVPFEIDPIGPTISEIHDQFMHFSICISELLYLIKNVTFSPLICSCMTIERAGVLMHLCL